MSLYLRTSSPFEGRTRMPFRARDFKYRRAVAQCTTGPVSRLVGRTGPRTKGAFPQSFPQSGKPVGAFVHGFGSLDSSTGGEVSS